MTVVAPAEDDEAAKKRKRLEAARLLMEKKKKAAAAAAATPAPPSVTLPGPRNLAEAAAAPVTTLDAVQKEEEVDPLDAFMEAEINPEVARREAEEKAAKAKAMMDRAEEIRAAREAGRDVRARADTTWLDDVDEEEKPDEEIEVPDNKVKLIIGAGGENIKRIQKKSKARLQVKKKGEELNKGFGGMVESEGMDEGGVPAAGMTIFMLFGSEDERAQAKRMIHELFDKAEAEKREKREKDREWQKKKRERERQMYHLRHRADYECLEVPLGAPKDECKKAYRKLAVRWHPDKHPEGPQREAAAKKFLEIQQAYNSLMTTDEEQTVEALAAAAQKQAKKEAAAENGVDLEAVKQSVAAAKEAALKAAEEAKRQADAAAMAAAREAYNRMK